MINIDYLTIPLSYNICWKLGSSVSEQIFITFCLNIFLIKNPPPSTAIVVVVLVASTGTDGEDKELVVDSGGRIVVALI